MIHLLFLILTVVSAFDRSEHAKPRGLDVSRAPYVAAEAKILSAMVCRDNFRIAANRTSEDLSYVIHVSQQCAQSAIYGRKYLVVSQNLTQYQMRLFTFNGYTLVPVGNDESGVPRYNITWRLVV